jgi:predicted nucleic acid-binding protein
MPSPLRPIIVDADALIALVDTQDTHTAQALSIAKRFRDEETVLLFPATVIAEAVTTLQRRLKKPALAAHIMAGTKARQFPIEPIDQTLLDEAALLFKPEGSKQNTLFDAIVAAVAKRHNAPAIFSFDEWYTKVGFTLASDLV